MTINQFNNIKTQLQLFEKFNHELKSEKDFNGARHTQLNNIYHT